jgi:hypothetical protein
VRTVARELRRGFVVTATVYSALWLVQSLELQTVAQFEPATLSNNVDRSNKANRLTPVPPAGRATILVGCERPFSSLAIVASSNFSMRCLT